MQERKIIFPVGASTALMQSVESMGSYIGVTRDQKRQILTDSLMDSQQTALQDEETKTE